jgi:hypothetical protein
MANEFIARTGLKVTGSAEISSSLTVADLAAGSGKVLSIGVGGKLQSSGYSINQDLNTSSTPTFTGLTINGTASIAYLSTTFESASIIYSSGSNIFGDASNDTQTLWGTINVMSGPTNFTGSVNSLGGYTGSLLGTSSWSTNATTANNATNLNSQAASYYLNASNINAGTLGNSYLPAAINVTSVTASVLGDLTGTSSYATQALTASYALNVPTTASYALQSLSSSFSSTASFVNSLNQDLIIATGSTQQTIFSKQQNIAVGPSISTVAAVTTTNVDAVFFDYVVKQSTTDMRAGTLMVVTNGSTVEYTEVSTLDIGNTSMVYLTADINGGQVRLRAVATSGAWTVRALARTI